MDFVGANLESFLALVFYILTSKNGVAEKL